VKITTMFHPSRLLKSDDYEKFRLTYEGGRAFVETYLEKFSGREDDDDFKARKNMSYCPAFAKEAVIEVRNGIHQRMSEVSRKGGSRSYLDAVDGIDGGVDLQGNNMNTFIGQEVLPEMMTMSRVGVMVDMPDFNPVSTLADFEKKPRPYLYLYRAEDIVNWSWVTRENEVYFTHLLLREQRITYDEASGLPNGESEVFRYMRLTQGGVLVQFWKADPKNKLSDELVSETLLKIKTIPFVLFDIKNSLLQDIADYQVGLLNLASSDLNYALRSNFPFYTEPYDPKTEDLYKSRPGAQIKIGTDGNVKVTEQDGKTPTTLMSGLPGNVNVADAQEISVGLTKGRRYPMGGDQPGFIHPSPEPLRASMDKQEQMKGEIRALLSLAISNVATTRASAESKRADQIGLESGLAALGLELEGGERQIARIWEMFEGAATNPAKIVYPTTYSLKSDEQRMNEAKQLKELKVAVPSKKFQKLMAGKIAATMFEGQVSTDILESVTREIDAANFITSDPEEIEKDMKMGLVTAETASNARGYDGAKEVPEAQKEMAERLAIMAISQAKGGGVGAARGIPGGPGDTSNVDEKTLSQDTPDLKPNPADPKTRGKGA
jgi:hypothetical protein